MTHPSLTFSPDSLTHPQSSIPLSISPPLLTPSQSLVPLCLSPTLNSHSLYFSGFGFLLRKSSELTLVVEVGCDEAGESGVEVGVRRS